MATISITEGKTAEVNTTDTLLYPEINSCLSITAVFADGKRVGGHAVFFLGTGQMNLQEICNYILQRKSNSTHLYIVGDTGTWDGNWKDNDQTKNLRINNVDVKSVAGIGPAMGYSAAQSTVYDTYNCDKNGSTYDIYFGFKSGKRVYWALDRKTQKECAAMGNPSW
jgi:uncharacterized phage-like protein YoqJ